MRHDCGTTYEVGSKVRLTIPAVRLVNPLELSHRLNPYKVNDNHMEELHQTEKFKETRRLLSSLLPALCSIKRF